MNSGTWIFCAVEAIGGLRQGRKIGSGLCKDRCGARWGVDGREAGPKALCPLQLSAAGELGWGRTCRAAEKREVSVDGSGV